MLSRIASASIHQDLAYFPVVGILGPRQVGKTTLAKTLMADIEKQGRSVVFIDLELESDLRKLDDAESYLKRHSDACVIIDEIQRKPELFALLRALVDMDRKPARFILLGSASPTVIKGTSESLAGRIAYTELMPLSQSETNAVVSRDQHWLRGGFPDALFANEPFLWSRWQSSFLTSFVKQDLQDLGQHVTPQLAMRLLQMVATLHGQILNQSTLARSLGISQPTVGRYLDLLEGCFLISRLQPYHANLSKRIVKQPRVYVRDSGTLHHLLNIHALEDLLGHAAVGASWEGYVIEEIRRQTLDRLSVNFYRTHAGVESDLFIVLPSGRKLCVEIKLSASQPVSRGYFSAIEDLKPDASFVVIPDSERYSDRNGIIRIGLREFLQNELTT